MVVVLLDAAHHFGALLHDKGLRLPRGSMTDLDAHL
jgi:hypothetical protein